MVYLISFFLRYFTRWWITVRIAKIIRRFIVKKYNADEKFIQNTKIKKEINWNEISWFSWLARYAYKTNEEIKEKYSTFDKIYINEINKIKYIVLTDDRTKTYYISIRGTTNSHNALQDIQFFKDKSFRLGINIHTGFHRTSEIIADDLLSSLDKTYSIKITGHSLGGAVAVVVAWYLDYSGYTIDECITFGQPKVTDTIGSRKMRGKIPLTRVVNETDVVSLVPPAGTHMNRYSHLGDIIKLLDDGHYCMLTEPDSLNFGVNSFWLFAARESLSFYEIGKELPDHYMNSYHENINKIQENPKEVLWKDRLQYISDSGIFGEFADEKKLLNKVKGKDK